MKTLISLLFLVVFTSSAQAGGEDASESLFDAIKSYDTLSADFQQRITDRDNVVIQESAGRFSIARPNKIYWQTKPPYEQEIIGDGSILWVYDADLEQVTQYNDGDILNGPMALFSRSLEDINARYSVGLESTNQNKLFVERYTLTPLESGLGEGFSALVFEFQDESLSAIEIHDKLRQITHLSLSNLEVNRDIPAERFQFVPPNGVDILVNE